MKIIENILVFIIDQFSYLRGLEAFFGSQRDAPSRSFGRVFGL